MGRKCHLDFCLPFVLLDFIVMDEATTTIPSPGDGDPFSFCIGLDPSGSHSSRAMTSPLWRSLLFRYGLWIGLLFALKLSSDRKGIGRIRGTLQRFFSHSFHRSDLPILGDVIQYLQPDIDPVLIRIDFFLFGVHPTVWMERWIVPWLTDLLSIAYGSYYFLPVSLG